MMRRNHARTAALAAAAGLVVLGAALWSCSGGEDSFYPGPRRTMLSDLANYVILPGYERLTNEATALVDATSALETSPAATTLAGAQLAWRRTRAAWKQSEAFAIGPAETLRTAAKIDFSPIRADRIESAIRAGGTPTADSIEELGANQKGFLAIEYLLFDPNGDAAAALADLGDAHRRALVRALAENLRDEVTLLRDAWAPDGGNFIHELVMAGKGSLEFPTVKSAVDELVNQLIFLSEEIADAQLLAALGRDTGTPDPEALDAHRSENGLADLLDGLTGLQNVYYGAYAGRDASGFSDVIVVSTPDIDGSIGLAIRRCFETATRIPGPLETALYEEPELVERAQVRAKELMRSLEVDLVSALGATLRFNPNDGD
jgi:predicted lipoprotein